MNITQAKHHSQANKYVFKIIYFGFSQKQWQGLKEIKSENDESVNLIIKSWE